MENASDPGYGNPVTPVAFVRTGPGNALDGQLKFNVNILNQAYFDRLRQRVIDAGNCGIYVSIMLFDDVGVSGAARWQGHPYNASNNVNGINGDGLGLECHTLAIPAITASQDAYVRKVIDTVNDLDNVLYEIDNEGPSESADWQYHMINLIKTYEAGKPKQHPVGMTALFPGTDSQLLSSAADWISPKEAADWENPPAVAGTKVIILDTDHMGGSNYWTTGAVRERAWVWKSFTRGYNPIIMDQLPELGGATGWAMTQSVVDDRRNALGYTLTYANKMNLAAMTPQNSLSSTGYILANVGTEYLAYQPASGSFTVTLAAGTYSVEWFNPAANTTSAAGTVNGGATVSFTPPFSGDAVLYLKSVTSGGPAGYTWCANENGSYNFGTTAVDVAYGANGLFNYRYGVTGTITFNNATFGDPIFGVAKAGYYRAAATPPTATFFKGIDLNGAAVTIGGNNWISYSSALSNGLSVSNATTWSGTYGFTPNPSPTTDELTMLQSGLYRSGPPAGQGFSLSQTLSNGTYQVYVWTIENYQSNFRNMDVKLEGTTVATAIGDLPLGSWQRYGPYSVTVSDGALDIDVLKNSKGDPCITGLEIDQVTTPTPTPVGGTLTDELTDFTKVNSHTANLGFDSTNANLFNGDTSRLYRTTTSIYENVVYNTASNMTSIEVDTYFWPSEAVVDFKLYTSGDGTTYIEFTPTKADLGGDWRRIKYTSSSLPVGTKYLKIEFRNTSANYWTPQISRVVISY